MRQLNVVGRIRKICEWRQRQNCSHSTLFQVGPLVEGEWERLWKAGRSKTTSQYAGSLSRNQGRPKIMSYRPMLVMNMSMDTDKAGVDIWRWAVWVTGLDTGQYVDHLDGLLGLASQHQTLSLPMTNQPPMSINNHQRPQMTAIDPATLNNA